MTRRRCRRESAALACACVVAVAACGEAATPATALRAAPSRYLLGVDDLVAPDFSADQPPEGGVSAASSATGLAAAALRDSGLVDAAGQDFLRDNPPLVILDGPAEIDDTAVELRSVAGAAGVYELTRAHLDSLPGARQLSTGALGDAAHAVTLSATAPGGVAVVEFVVVWRVANVVDVLVVRGRNGGVRLEDALLLAHRQTVIELASEHG